MLVFRTIEPVEVVKGRARGGVEGNINADPAYAYTSRPACSFQYQHARTYVWDAYRHSYLSREQNSASFFSVRSMLI
jgi:hypothetical protein